MTIFRSFNQVPCMLSPASLPVPYPFNIRPSSIGHIKQIHAQLITTRRSTPSILAALIQHYLHSSDPRRIPPNYARLIVEHGADENPFLLNVLIRCSKPRDSIIIFADWVSKSTVEFDDRTYVFTLGACARSPTKSALYEGMQVHARLVKNGFMSDLLVATTAVHFYACSPNVAHARQVFDEMPDRNSAAWGALIKGYCSQEARSDKGTLEGYLVFKEMLADESGVRPTDITMICVVSAASHLRVPEIGAGLHGYVEKIIYAAEGHVHLATALVEMYSKCGCPGSALAVFRRMQERNVFTWTAMMTGLVAHGRVKQALELLDEMSNSNILPNVVTFTSLISAGCGAGLADECLQLLHSMESNFRLKPNIRHYKCIFDLLVRVGRLEEAYGITARMSDITKARALNGIQDGEKVPFALQ